MTDAIEQSDNWNWPAFVDAVQEIGLKTLAMQSELQLGDISHKGDGSILTKADLASDTLLREAVAQHLPGVRIISEEVPINSSGEGPWQGEQPVIFIDPIDGTDPFSQGMPTWAISVGIVGRDGKPAAGIVHTPGLSQLTHACNGQSCIRRWAPDGSTTEQAITRKQPVNIDHLSTMATSWRVHQQLDLAAFPGNVMSTGAAAVHLIMPALYPRMAAALQEGRGYAWDIAGAHAIAEASGLQMRTLDGCEINYRELAKGTPVGPFVMVAHADQWDQLNDLIRDRS